MIPFPSQAEVYETMIVKDSDAIKRLDSPMNLINRLRRPNKKDNAMSLFGINKSQKGIDIGTEEVKISFNPFQPLAPVTTAPKKSLEIIKKETSIDSILENHDSQIKLGLAHDNALKLLNNSIEILATKLDDIKSDKLPSVIGAASKVVESIRRERSEAAKLGKDRDVHFHFYTPEQKAVSSYEIIEVQ